MSPKCDLLVLQTPRQAGASLKPAVQMVITNPWRGLELTMHHFDDLAHDAVYESETCIQSRRSAKTGSMNRSLNSCTIPSNFGLSKRANSGDD